MKQNIILGIDPGTLKTGFALLKTQGQTLTLLDSGVIKTSQKEPLHKRYHTIFKEISILIKQHKPLNLSIETQFMQKNVASAMKISMARAAALIAATDKNLEVFEYTPTTVKKSVATNGQASKEQMIGMINSLLRLKEPIQSDDEADAVGLAICHYLRQKRIVYV